MSTRDIQTIFKKKKQHTVKMENDILFNEGEMT